MPVDISSGASLAIGALQNSAQQKQQRADQQRATASHIGSTLSGLGDSLEKRRKGLESKAALQAIAQDLGVDPNSPVMEDPDALLLEIHQRRAEKSATDLRAHQERMQQQVFANQGRMAGYGPDEKGTPGMGPYDPKLDDRVQGANAIGTASAGRAKTAVEEARDFAAKEMAKVAQGTTDVVNEATQGYGAYAPGVTAPTGAAPQRGPLTQEGITSVVARRPVDPRARAAAQQMVGKPTTTKWDETPEGYEKKKEIDARHARPVAQPKTDQERIAYAVELAKALRGVRGGTDQTEVRRISSELTTRQGKIRLIDELRKKLVVERPDGDDKKSIEDFISALQAEADALGKGAPLVAPKGSPTPAPGAEPETPEEDAAEGGEEEPDPSQMSEEDIIRELMGK